MQTDDIKFMKMAISLAKKAANKDEVPVGCVIVKDGKVIAKAYNLREKTQIATAHAELLAINKACKKTESFRLSECALYVTLEPCPMCAGAIINSRINRLVFGASDPKGGCCGSLYNLTGEGKFNHKLIVEGGILKEECAMLLKDFFVNKRKNSKI